MGDEEVLLRCGVMTSSGELTKAGLLCLGIYPQQYLPSYTIRASVQKQSRQTGRVRATNTHSFDGPIPTMLYEAVQWVRENSDELVLDSANGSVRNVGEYPSIVMRELIANSLIHRDIGPMALHQDISLIVEDDRLVISNPGGLYGLHVDELGRTGSKTRNSRMADICQYVLASDGANVIEKLGSGIPRVLDELADLSMPSPRFIDGGIYFTVILDSVLARSPVGETPNSNRVGEDSVLTLLRQGPKSKSQIQRATRLTPTQTRHTIEKLIAEQRIQKIGKDKSPNTTYALLLDE
jgi:ATP-dependent DNA helicase RecG